MSPIRVSSVVPAAAVKPKRARVETTRPSVVAAFFLVFARICGCYRWNPPTDRQVNVGTVTASASDPHTQCGQGMGIPSAD
jgi:hypothetical protein